MSDEHRNPPMSVVEMRAHAATAGECPHCDLMWQWFVAAAGDSDRLREELHELQARDVATAATAQDALTLIDDLMRQQDVAIPQTGWTGGVKWRADKWAELVERRDVLARTHEAGGAHR